ncbi:nucleoside-diphosphate sugar epimerase [Luteimicrobium subarcticum]|uniref:Nucleoside-diphosphate-sugar epimerase n=1 Tax=Luteimicrobium subarcticum TaxID=620910 RepID=A0A2M8WUY5_9MICO|nr:nucleoside-diphosphate sugar epimerase [Luteimicrobium subarcticum]PJI94740.1 hypothetical protein CLV34_0587 [Luteimicrobium subarcticum]
MQEGRLRSERSAAAAGGAEESRLVVVGAGGITGGLAVRLRARHLTDVPAGASGPTRLADARTVVVVAHTADFDREAYGRPARREALSGLVRRVVAAAPADAHLVLVGSAMVCGARPGAAPVDDDAPVAPEVAGGHGVGHLLAQVEQAFRDAVGVRRATVLRAAPVVGPGADTLVTRHFEAPRLLAVSDAAREWQFLHLDDLATAVEAVVEHGLVGTVTAGTVHDDGSPDVLTSAQVAELADRRLLTLSRATALGIAEQLHRVGAVPSPPDELFYAVYSWTVTARRLHAAGWRPQVGAAACVREAAASGRGTLTVAGRRLGGRDAAALGAAGAAVALLGTAAAWRQARGRR